MDKKIEKARRDGKMPDLDYEEEEEEDFFDPSVSNILNVINLRVYKELKHANFVDYP